MTKTINTDSETWQIISTRLENEMKKAGLNTLQKGLSIEETEYWRGVYQGLKLIKDMPNENKEQVFSSDYY